MQVIYKENSGIIMHASSKENIDSILGYEKMQNDSGHDEGNTDTLARDSLGKDENKPVMAMPLFFFKICKFLINVFCC